MFLVLVPNYFTRKQMEVKKETNTAVKLFTDSSILILSINWIKIKTHKLTIGKYG